MGKQPIRTSKRNFLPLLSKRRTWFDGDEAPPVTPVEPVTPTNTPEPKILNEDKTVFDSTKNQQDELVDFNATDAEGKRLYFEQQYVSDLRTESRQHRETSENVQRELDELKQAQVDAKAASLNEQEQYKELSENYKQQLETMQQTLLQQEHSALMDRVAAKFNLPEALISRLVGTTEAELEADAQKIAALFVQQKQQPPAGQDVSPAPDATPPVRGDADRRGEYFAQADNQPRIFQASGKHLQFFKED